VQHDVGRKRLHFLREPGVIPDIARRRCDDIADPCEIMEAGLRRRRQRIPLHFGTQAVQQQAEPASLEAGVPGHEDTPPSPELAHGPPHRFLRIDMVRILAS